MCCWHPDSTVRINDFSHFSPTSPSINPLFLTIQSGCHQHINLPYFYCAGLYSKKARQFSRYVFRFINQWLPANLQYGNYSSLTYQNLGNHKNRPKTSIQYFFHLAGLTYPHFDDILPFLVFEEGEISMANPRRLKTYLFRGEWLSKLAIANLVGLSPTTISNRLSWGWKDEQLSLPPGAYERAPPGEGRKARSMRPKTFFECRYQLERAIKTLDRERARREASILDHDSATVRATRERAYMKAKLAVDHWRTEIDSFNQSPPQVVPKYQRVYGVTYCARQMKKAEIRAEIKGAAFDRAHFNREDRQTIQRLAQEYKSEADRLDQWKGRYALAISGANPK